MKRAVVVDKYVLHIVANSFCFRNDKGNKSPVKLNLRPDVGDTYKVTGGFYRKVTARTLA